MALSRSPGGSYFLQFPSHLRPKRVILKLRELFPPATQWRGLRKRARSKSKQMSSIKITASLVAQLVKNPPARQETWVWSLGWEDPLERGKSTHSSILAWRTPWTIQSMGLQRVGHNWATFTFTFPWRSKWLRFHARNAEGPGLIPGQGIRSHMLQLRPSTAK